MTNVTAPSSADSDAAEKPVIAPSATGAARNIHDAINRVRSRVEAQYVQKKARPGLNFKSTSIEDFEATLKPFLNEQGIIVYPVAARHLWSEQVETKSGGSQTNRCFELEYEFVHADTETKQVVRVIAEANDTSDKASAKCMTAGLKQALKQVLQIETGEEDPDRFHAERAGFGARPLFVAAKKALESAPGKSVLVSKWQVTEDYHKSGRISDDEIAELRQIRDARSAQLSQAGPAPQPLADRPPHQRPNAANGPAGGQAGVRPASVQSRGSV